MFNWHVISSHKRKERKQARGREREQEKKVVVRNVAMKKEEEA